VKGSLAVSRRKLLLSRHRASFLENQHILYKPIYKLDKGILTQEEWITILMNSVSKINTDDGVHRDLGL
jgi:hypothetical protein